jgi:hypothetical protein
MPTATIHEIWCVTPATGTDFSHLTPQIKNVLSGVQTVPIDPTVQSVSQVVGAMPELVQALDQVRADPDSLYLTVSDRPGFENSVWPNDGRETAEMHKGAIATPGLTLSFDTAMSLSLWDKDSSLSAIVGGSDDLLGSIQIHPFDGTVAKMAMSDVEGSFYYVTYTAS